MAFFKSLVDKIKQGFEKGLEKTRETFISGVQGLRNLLLGRKLDEALIDELHRTMLQADVGLNTTTRLIDRIRADFRSGKMERGEQVLEYLKDELKAMWPPQDRELKFAQPGTGPTVILMTGVNGVGKTTSIAKLCRMLTAQNKTVLLGACDTFRAGAVHQLEVWANRLGVEVVKGQQEEIIK